MSVSVLDRTDCADFGVWSSEAVVVSFADDTAIGRDYDGTYHGVWRYESLSESCKLEGPAHEFFFEMHGYMGLDAKVRKKGEKSKCGLKSC